MYRRKNENLIWVVLGAIFLALMGSIVYLVWPKERERQNEKNNYNEEVQQLRAQLILLKSQLSSLPDNKRIHLENRLFILEDYINDLINDGKSSKSVIKNLEKEIKNLKERLKEDDNPDDYEDRISTIFKWSNSDKSGYQLFKSAKQKGIKVYVAKDHSFLKGKKLDDSSDTPPFSIRFEKKYSSKQEEDENFYFDKDNTNFELGAFDNWPDETEKNERKLEYVKENSLGNHVFSDSPDDAQIFFIVDKNHPRIKQMLSEGKLKAGKEFIIRYGKVDKNFTSISFFFNEFNEELEIIESS